MKNILITGGAKRLGFIMAQHLSQKHNIIITYNTSHEEALELPSNIKAIKLDISNAEEVAAFWNSMDIKIDVLINSASFFENDFLGNVTQDCLERHMKVNCYGPILMTHHMELHNDQPKKVIFMLDKWARDAKNFLSYSLSKLALEHFVHKLIGSSNTKAYGILLGFILYNDKFPRDFFDRMQKTYPSSVEDLLNALDFILENDTLNGDLIDLGQWKSHYLTN